MNVNALSSFLGGSLEDDIIPGVGWSILRSKKNFESFIDEMAVSMQDSLWTLRAIIFLATVSHATWMHGLCNMLQQGGPYSHAG